MNDKDCITFNLPYQDLDGFIYTNCAISSTNVSHNIYDTGIDFKYIDTIKEDKDYKPLKDRIESLEKENEKLRNLISDLSNEIMPILAERKIRKVYE